MPTYFNASDSRLVFPDLQRQDGRTVELDPGEQIDLADNSGHPELVEIDPANVSTNAPTVEEPVEPPAPAAPVTVGMFGAQVPTETPVDPAPAVVLPAPDPSTEVDEPTPEGE